MTTYSGALDSDHLMRPVFDICLSYGPESLRAVWQAPPAPIPLPPPLPISRPHSQVHYILDEIVMGGMVLETNIAEVMDAVMQMNALEASTKAASIRA